MQTIVLQEPGTLELTETAPPPEVLGQGDVLVRVHRVGICGTDIHAFAGEQPFFSYPRIIGHELGVEVLEVGGGVTNVEVGDRCAVEPYLSCGQCHACSVGRTNCCVDMKVLGVQTEGGMRELIVVPARLLHKSASLGYDALALVEMLGIGCHAVSRAAVAKGERVAVIGLGPIGLTAAQFALLAGAEVTGIDVSEERAASAKRLLGLDTLVITPGESLDEQWQAAKGGRPVKVFDVTGNRHSMQAAFQLPEHGGTLVFVGLVLGDVAFDDPNFHRREMTVMSSRNALPEDFRVILEHMEAGRIDPASWITHRCEVAELPGVFADWIKPEAKMLKGVVSFS